MIKKSPFSEDPTQKWPEVVEVAVLGSQLQGTLRLNKTYFAKNFPEILQQILCKSYLCILFQFAVANENEYLGIPWNILSLHIRSNV